MNVKVNWVKASYFLCSILLIMAAYFIGSEKNSFKLDEATKQISTLEKQLEMMKDER